MNRGAVGRLYNALGTRTHETAGAGDHSAITAAIAETGLPESVAAAVDDESRDAAVRAAHEASRPRLATRRAAP
jgi:hypothetical protein